MAYAIESNLMIVQDTMLNRGYIPLFSFQVSIWDCAFIYSNIIVLNMHLEYKDKY